MIRHLILAAGTAFAMSGGAQACQPSYTVKDGDTLFSIAEAQIGDLTKWSLIFYNNPDLQGGSLLEVPVGTVLDIPCPEGSVQKAPDPTPLQQADAELTIGHSVELRAVHGLELARARHGDGTGERSP